MLGKLTWGYDIRSFGIDDIIPVLLRLLWNKEPKSNIVNNEPYTLKGF